MNISVVTLGIGTWHLVDHIERQHGSVTVVRRCLDLSELLACALTGMARVALIADGAEELTASLLEQLALGGVRVLVVSGHDDHRLAELGVPTVPAQATPDELIRLIEDAAGAPETELSHRGHARPGDHPASTPHFTREEADPGVQFHGTPGEDGSLDVVRESRPPGVERARPTEEGTATGRIITVWGPMGSPGRTVVAVNVAAELAATQDSVLLIDADTYAASVAASLGMLEEAAGLAQACRLADQGRLDEEGLRRCVTRVSVAGASLDVLTGLTRHDRWPEVRAAALDTVLVQARNHYRAVVVDTSFGLESDEEISVDVVAPRRNAATLSACAMADTLVAVGAADAVGIPRLVKTLPDLVDTAPTAGVLVVVNKLRRASVGRSGADAVREAWERFSTTHAIAATLDWDPQSCDEALLAGAVLAESAPKSALRQQIAALAGRCLHPVDSEAHEAPPPGSVPGTRLGQRMGAWLRR